jgi:lipoprotein-anchoring transpeptidase ErfK/SrfK
MTSSLRRFAACRSLRIAAPLAAALMLAGTALGPARAQSPAITPPPLDSDVGDEPGRVSTSEVFITEGLYRRELVFFRSPHPAGTVVIDTNERYLYLVLDGNRALRYGIGVGREGFQWAGLETISRKSEWPDWTPPPEMIDRQPYLPRFMAGGPGNPMGARALYLGKTVYRIHGTNQPETIGLAVSSGCFRLANGDVIDLYARVPVGARVVIRHAKQL